MTAQLWESETVKVAIKSLPSVTVIVGLLTDKQGRIRISLEGNDSVVELPQGERPVTL